MSPYPFLMKLHGRRRRLVAAAAAEVVASYAFLSLYSALASINASPPPAPVLTTLIASADLHSMAAGLVAPVSVPFNLCVLALLLAMGSAWPPAPLVLGSWLAFAALFAAAYWLFMRTEYRRERWIRSGHCGRCGYDVRGLDQRCSECGEPIAARRAAPSASGST